MNIILIYQYFTFSLGYNVILVSDAHSTFSNKLYKPEDLIKYLTYIYTNWFAKLISSAEISFEKLMQE